MKSLFITDLSNNITMQWGMHINKKNNLALHVGGTPKSHVFGVFIS